MSYVEFEQVPAGVEVLKDYPSLKATLVQCTHAEQHRTQMLSRPWCSLCKADERATDGFSDPVKFMAVLPVTAVAAQESLFA